MKRSIRVWKRIEGVMVSCLLFVFLTGCSEVQLQNGTNLQLEKEGGVTVTYIEEFSADYYDIDELDVMNREEVEEYNQSAGSTVVEVLATETDGSKLTLSMHYADVEDYGDMNGIPIYSGTVGQAVAMGYDLNKSFLDVKSGEKISDINWKDLESYHVVIVNENCSVYPYKKIEYVTENVKVSDDRKMATVTSDETQAVIVFK